jgi:hypothetical protein
MALPHDLALTVMAACQICADGWHQLFLYQPRDLLWGWCSSPHDPQSASLDSIKLSPLSHLHLRIAGIGRTSGFMLFFCHI